MNLKTHIDKRWDVMKLMGTQKGSTDDLILKHLQWRYVEEIYIRENRLSNSFEAKSKEIITWNDNSSENSRYTR